MLTFAVATAAVIVGLLAFDITRWCESGRVLTRKQKIIRVLSAGIALSILSFMVLGWRATEAIRIFAALGYWMVCLGLAFALIFLALFDIREVGVGYGKEKRRILRDLISPMLRRRKSTDDSGNGHRRRSQN